MTSVMVTGGAGYIGSHVCLQLLQTGHDVIVVDNLSNGKSEHLAVVERLTGKKLTFFKQDIRDSLALEKIFKERKVEAVIHLAGFKSVGDSHKQSLVYYDNNIGGFLTC